MSNSGDPSSLKFQQLQEDVLIDWLNYRGYEVLRRLGAGGFGKVYEATEIAANRSVAIKVLNELPDDTGYRERYRREVQSLAAFRHENIVPLLAALEEPRFAAIAMEFIPGGSLAQHLAPFRAKQFEPLQIIKWILPAVRGVAAAHSQNFVHRDLKPDNILLRDNPSAVDLPSPLNMIPMIADFGLVRHATSGATVSMAGIEHGTPGYMPPEQYAESTTDPMAFSDVYSLGVTLFELLAGHRPYESADQPISKSEFMKEIKRRTKTLPIPRLHHVHPDLGNIVEKCLQTDPQDRYQSSKELADDLERFINGEPVLARPISTLTRFGRKTKKLLFNRRAVAVIIAILGPTLFLIYRLDSQQRQAKRDQLAQQLEADHRLNLEKREAQLTDLRRTAADQEKRGDWYELVRTLDQLLTESPADSPDAEVARARALMAINNTARFRQELDRMTAIEPNPYGSRFLLLRAEDALTYGTRREEGQALAKSALEQQNLTPADAAYAQALIETRPNQHIKALQDALALEPRHPFARRSLMVAYTFVGRFKEAREQGQLVQLLRPDDPLPDFVEALIAGLELRKDAIPIHLNKLEGKIPADDLTRIREYLDVFTKFLIASQEANNAEIVNVQKINEVTKNMNKMSEYSERAMNAVAAPSASFAIGPAMFQRISEAMFGINLAFNVAAKRKQADLLEQLSQDFPERLFLNLQLEMLFASCQEYAVKNDWPKLRTEMARIAGLAKRAAVAPSILTGYPQQLKAMWIVAFEELMMVLLDKEWKSDRLQELRDHVYAFLNHPREPWLKKERESGISALMIIVQTEMPINEYRKAAGWSGTDEEIAAQVAERRAILNEFGRLLLIDREMIEGPTASVRVRRAQLEFNAGRLDTAREYLKNINVADLKPAGKKVLDELTNKLNPKDPPKK